MVKVTDLAVREGEVRRVLQQHAVACLVDLRAPKEPTVVDRNVVGLHPWGLEPQGLASTDPDTAGADVLHEDIPDRRVARAALDPDAVPASVPDRHPVHGASLAV